MKQLVKIVFSFIFILMGLSCSTKKEVFLPDESLYSKNVRAISDSAARFTDLNYPIKIGDKPPFQYAVHRDRKELNRLFLDVFSALWQPAQPLLESWTLYWRHQTSLNPKPNEKGEKGYIIISCDEEYIYSGVVRENDSLYAKYNPQMEDDKDCSIKKTRNHSTFFNWITQEMNKGNIISITGNKKTFIAKSFNQNKSNGEN